MSSYLADTPIAICPRCSRDGDDTATTGMWHTCPACGGEWQRRARGDDTPATTRLGNTLRRVHAYCATPRGYAVLNAAGGLVMQLAILAALWFGVAPVHPPLYYGLLTLFGVTAVSFGSDLVKSIAR